MNLNELSSKFANDYTRYKTTGEKIDKQIERLKKKQSRNLCPRWIDTILQPIADELCLHLPDYRSEILGPFGLCAETAIHLYKRGLTKEELWSDEGRKDKAIKSITFVPGDLNRGEIKIRDVATDSGKFARGTIGELNGLNHPSIAIPEDADIEWLLKYVQ